MSFKSKLYQIAKKNKKELAVTSHGGSFSYDDLLKHSKSIMNAISKEKRVGLFFEKSKEYISTLFALTLSETAFVPLEVAAPKERLEYILKDAEIETIITSKKYVDDIEKIPSYINILFFEDLIDIHFENDFVLQPEEPNEPAYVIYTSGSTGNPKGVEVSFNGLSNVIEQQIDITNMNKSKFYLYLAISFDASLSDIYCSLLSASQLFIYDCLKRNAIGLKNYFNEVGITHSDLPPSLLKLLQPSDFSTLKSIIIGGEVADYSSVQSFAKAMKVVNVYGPTEATICTSMIVCDEHWSKPLIGHPLKNVGYKIINEYEKEINSEEKDVVGELVISGCQLANGYINNPEMNNKSFVLMSFGDKEERYYKTGDYVSYTDNGLIEFKGRVDRQIKYHGQLINLEEVESAINSISSIESVSVIFKNKKMYAYYEGSISEKEIRNELKSKVPVYMIPSFIINKAIPKTVTGKNDGKLLSKEDSFNDEVLVLSSLFKTILEIEDDIIIEPNLSFIKDLSGDSLDFVQLHLTLQQRGMNISYDYLIENNSINDILNYKEESSMITTDFLINEFNKLEKIENIGKEKQENKVALITGSTGFLGSSLLEKLTNSFDKVYCLIRGRDINNAKSKLDNALEQFGITIKNKDRIEIIVGDVSEEYLGLKTSDYDKLSSDVDVVYHCAAVVNNLLNYQQLYKANVESTVNVSKFVFNKKVKHLHYASTLSVYVSSDQLNDTICYEKALTNDGHQLYSGYAQTKWLSEYYLNQLQEPNDNISIYRFGLLTPSTSNPELKDKSFLANTIRDLKEIGEIPVVNVDLSMDITPLDVAVEAMFNISQKIKEGGIYHVSSNYQLTLNKIAEILKLDSKYDAETWFNTYGSYNVAQYMTDINNPYMKQHNMNLFETTNINHFDVSNAKDFIPVFNIEDYLINLMK